MSFSTKFKKINNLNNQNYNYSTEKGNKNSHRKNNSEQEK